MTATPSVGSTFFGLDTSQLAAQLWSLRRRISKRVLVLEFGPTSLLLAEATLATAGVQLSHVSSIQLPPEALDRGVPAEPLKMAGLIQEFCSEKQIPANRAAVVLPPELAFQRLLDLPATLTTDEAREFVLNPANGLQIPFPLTQTDFDLFPVSTPTVEQQAGGNHLYMLTAIPEVLVNPIVEMLQAADMELQLLELGSHSQLRTLSAELIMLAPQQIDLVLEMLPDHCELMFVTRSGLLASERLAPIRNFPIPDLEADRVLDALNAGLSAEELSLNDERYLPISDLDLRGLVTDLHSAFERFHVKFPGSDIRRLILAGVNSSHPQLTDLLAEMLGLSVVSSRPDSSAGFAGWSADDLLLQSGLGRLIGLSAGLLPREQLTADSSDEHDFSDGISSMESSPVAISNLLNFLDDKNNLDKVDANISGISRSYSKVDIDSVNLDGNVMYEKTSIQVDAVPNLDSIEPLADQVSISIANAEENNKPSMSSKNMASRFATDENSPKASSVPVSHESPLAEDWPSIHSAITDEKAVVEEIEDDEQSSQQWPSIYSDSTAEQAVVEEIEDDEQSSQQWPSIHSDSTEAQAVVEEIEDDEQSAQQWLSISSFNDVSEKELGSAHNDFISTNDNFQTVHDPSLSTGFAVVNVENNSSSRIFTNHQHARKDLYSVNSQDSPLSSSIPSDQDTHDLDSLLLEDAGSFSLDKESEQVVSYKDVTSVSENERAEIPSSDSNPDLPDFSSEEVINQNDSLICGLEISNSILDDANPLQQKDESNSSEDVTISTLGDLRFADEEV